jgi:hypothetical protein
MPLAGSLASWRDACWCVASWPQPNRHGDPIPMDHHTLARLWGALPFRPPRWHPPLVVVLLPRAPPPPLVVDGALVRSFPPLLFSSFSPAFHPWNPSFIHPALARHRWRGGHMALATCHLGTAGCSWRGEKELVGWVGRLLAARYDSSRVRWPVSLSKASLGKVVGDGKVVGRPNKPAPPRWCSSYALIDRSRDVVVARCWR